MSLRTRLALIVAAVVTAVVGLGALLQVYLFERRVEANLRQAALQAAGSVAAGVGSWPDEPTASRVHDELESRSVQPPVREIVMLIGSPGGDETFVTSGAEISPDQRNLARAAWRDQRVVWHESGGASVLVGAPVSRGGRPFGGVVVTVSLQDVRVLARRQRRILLWLTAAAVVAVPWLVSVFARRYVHAPIESLLETMGSAGAGDLGARVRVHRRDEIGKVADGLNDMLAHTQQLHDSLRDRVDEATRDLSRSNDDVVASYQRMFALREALARAEQTAAAGQTAANLAHQIGTPLNLISGYVQMMLEQTTDSRQVERLRSVQEQIKKVTGHVRATLDHVRRPPLAKNPVFPAAILHRISEIAGPRLKAAGITLDLDVPAELPWLLGDPVQLELALLNLINNGLEAMPDGGTLRLHARADGNVTRIEVSDTGAGIPDELLPRIFEPWVTTKPVGRGTGLGLSITREVVAAHGGTIHAESPPRSGATFIVELPGKAGAPAIREV